MPKFCGSSSPYSLFGSRTGILWNLSRKINLCVPLKYMYKTITKLYTASQQRLRSWLFFFIPAVSQKLNSTTFAPSSLFFHFLLRSASLSCCIFNILLLENRICLCGRTYLGQSADIISSSSSFLDFFAHDPPLLPPCHHVALQTDNDVIEMSITTNQEQQTVWRVMTHTPTNPLKRLLRDILLLWQQQDGASLALSEPHSCPLEYIAE